MIKDDEQLNACKIKLNVTIKIIEFCKIMGIQLYSHNNKVYRDELLLINAETFIMAKKECKILQERIKEYKNKTND